MGGFLSTFFVSAPLLLGAFGAAVPFILHMVYRRRAPKIQFSTLRFIRESAERTARRRHIREWLLLLLRSAAIFLLAVGLAGPIFRGVTLGGKDTAAVVLVLDNSASMAAEWEQTSAYARARDGAVKILGQLASDSQAAVIYVCPPPGGSRLANMLTTDRNGLAEELSRSEVSAVEGDLAAAIAGAEKLLQQATTDQREVYVFTDFQARAWRPLPEPPSVRRPTLLMVDCGIGESANVAVAEADVSSVRPAVGVPLTFKTRIRNFSALQKEAKVTLYVDRQVWSEQAVKVAPQAEAETAFSVTLKTPGVHTGWVDLQVDDILPLDNRRYFSLDVPDRIHVGLVRERDGAVPLLDEAFFLAPALNPSAAGLPVASAIEPTKLVRADLAGKRLGRYAVLFLLNLPELTPAELRGVLRYVETGGAVVLFPGDAVKPGAWNGLLKSTVPSERTFLPAAFGALLPEGSGTAELITLDKSGMQFEHPALRPLESMGLSFFDSVVMKRYFQLKPVEGGGARTLMTLSNGLPFLLEKDIGQGHGRVMQFCTTATTRGSNLPTRRLFLPLMHQITYYLAQSQDATEDVRPGRAVRFAGITLPKDDAERHSPVEVTDPRGVTSAASLEKGEAETAWPVFADTARCGVYHWRRTGDDAREGAFTVNLNVEEGDLTPLDREKLTQSLLAGRRAHFARTAEEAVRVATRLREGLRLETPLLFVVIGLLLLECLLANQTRTYRPEDHVRVTGTGVAIS